MNIKRILFWLGFVIVLGLIVWGMVVAMNKAPTTPISNVGTPSPVTVDDHIRGPVGAPVTLIEFADFQCPACESYEPLLQKLESAASTTLRVVYRHYPLSQHKNAMPAARAAEAAAMQGKFWEMHDMIFAEHTDWTELADATPIFEGYATKLGLDIDKFRADMAGSAAETRIQRDLGEAGRINVAYTPTFFVNGKAIANPKSYEEFKSIIDAAAQASH